MTLNVQDIDLPARVLPGPASPLWEQPDIVWQLADADPAGYDDNWVRPGDPAGQPTDRQALIDTYGTADPELLAAGFALDEDVATARRIAAEARRVAA